MQMPQTTCSQQGEQRTAMNGVIQTPVLLSGQELTGSLTYAMLTLMQVALPSEQPSRRSSSNVGFSNAKA
jgi:hypothetical protein